MICTCLQLGPGSTPHPRSSRDLTKVLPHSVVNFDLTRVFHTRLRCAALLLTTQLIMLLSLYAPRVHIRYLQEKIDPPPPPRFPILITHFLHINLLCLVTAVLHTYTQQSVYTAHKWLSSAHHYLDYMYAYIYVHVHIDMVRIAVTRGPSSDVGINISVCVKTVNYMDNRIINHR